MVCARQRRLFLDRRHEHFDRSVHKEGRVIERARELQRARAVAAEEHPRDGGEHGHRQACTLECHQQLQALESRCVRLGILGDEQPGHPREISTLLSVGLQGPQTRHCRDQRGQQATPRALRHGRPTRRGHRRRRRRCEVLLRLEAQQRAQARQERLAMGLHRGRLLSAEGGEHAQQERALRGRGAALVHGERFEHQREHVLRVTLGGRQLEQQLLHVRCLRRKQHGLARQQGLHEGTEGQCVRGAVAPAAATAALQVGPYRLRRQRAHVLRREWNARRAQRLLFCADKQRQHARAARARRKRGAAWVRVGERREREHGDEQLVAEGCMRRLLRPFESRLVRGRVRLPPRAHLCAARRAKVAPLTRKRLCWGIHQA